MSYREKAMRAAAEAGDEAARFSAASHAREAARLLPGISDELSREAGRLGALLREALAQQERLVARVQEGTLKAAKANRLNRKVATSIEGYRASLAELNRCLQARSSDELGGFLDMPLSAYVGGVKKKPLQIPVKPTPVQFVLWVGMVAMAVLGSLYYLDYFEEAPPVALEVGQMDPGTGAIKVMCRNDSQAPILLYVPWHGPIVGENTGGLTPYGLALYVREADSRQFRMFPVPVSAWSYQGRTMREGGPIEVAPHLYVNLVLDEQDALAGMKPEALRISLLNADGKPVVEHQINLHR